jgi:pyruvate dehydrogenase E1 component alpha subunit
VTSVREQKDPIDALKKRLLDLGHVDEEGLKAIEAEVREIVNDSAEFAQTSPEPDPSDLYTDVLVGA